MHKNGVIEKEFDQYEENPAGIMDSSNILMEIKSKTMGGDRIKEAENHIQNIIILRAWRSQREKNNSLEKDVKSLSNQLENLQMQTYALKQLLDAEKTRVVQANNDLKKVLTTLEEYKYEKKTLINEKEQLESRLQSLEDQLMSMENECKNKKNELMTARLESHNWEKQLEKEREKLSRLKDEKKFLIDEDAETNEISKEATNHNNSRKSGRDPGSKCGSYKGGKKTGGRGGREDRGIGKIDFRKNVGYIKKLLKEGLCLYDEPD